MFKNRVLLSIVLLSIGVTSIGHALDAGGHVLKIKTTPAMASGEYMPKDYSYLYGIMVNREGGRFVDEGENFFAYTCV